MRGPTHCRRCEALIVQRLLSFSATTRFTCFANCRLRCRCTAIESVCAAAREQGIAVEQLLIILKERWRELPEAERLLRRAAEETRARLITICIDAYYAPYHRK